MIFVGARAVLDSLILLPEIQLPHLSGVFRNDQFNQAFWKQTEPDDNVRRYENILQRKFAISIKLAWNTHHIHYIPCNDISSSLMATISDYNETKCDKIEQNNVSCRCRLFYIRKITYKRIHLPACVIHVTTVRTRSAKTVTQSNWLHRTSQLIYTWVQLCGWE